ncbi:hypothetical protein GCM10007320_19080 [Pseudorhodoferax aquiterrae]|uniref:GGDEF domain-containing protein n=1 Tax=Pseudorhodoferax aquiterrae TaxID=747304 RepID=A0ABQ3FZC3_9BURK|nr:hypothetical protein [Pseudorhodoferax aquiterrae]GHC78557.1 hypothetical protein GCM10007320_19080 [Pseudorhodoferax aquiterrae]
MHSPRTRTELLRCRETLAQAEVSDELRELAEELLERLLGMHDARRLNGPVFLLALDSLELVPGLQVCVEALRAAVLREVDA